jgi:hypothetical protein
MKNLSIKLTHKAGICAIMDELIETADRIECSNE